jgi:hypothetical protein
MCATNFAYSDMPDQSRVKHQRLIQTPTVTVLYLR